jgi:hypothetical protein
VAAGNCRKKSSAMYYSKLGKMGKDNPMKTKMLMRCAKNDYMHDISEVGANPISTFVQRINYYKTVLELNFNSGYRNAKKAINDSVKELYPRTYKARNKLINKGKVSIENTTDTATRLENLNIKPDSLILSE